MTTPLTAARDKLNGIKADFWDCEGAEVLTFLDPISALEGCVENHRRHDMLTEETIREMGAITVSAYRRKVITEEMVRDLADIALDAIVEYLEEQGELGHPEGDHPIFSVQVLAQHRGAFESAVRDLAARAKIWQCEVSHRVELAPDETIELLLVERPEWFGAEARAELQAEQDGLHGNAKDLTGCDV